MELCFVELYFSLCNDCVFFFFEIRFSTLIPISTSIREVSSENNPTPRERPFKSVYKRFCRVLCKSSGITIQNTRTSSRRCNPCDDLITIRCVTETESHAIPHMWNIECIKVTRDISRGVSQTRVVHLFFYATSGSSMQRNIVNIFFRIFHRSFNIEL